MDEKRMRPPEILAPAGTPEAVRAAVNAGADAVYLGGRRFSARNFAANFTEEELDEAVSYAHFRGVKIYVAVNTLIHDRELPGLARYLRDLFLTGIDAILVQDFGVASLARELVPELPLHASTQATILSAEGLRWGKSAGFERVVLARELSLPEIDRLFTVTTGERPEIEIFAHGALCYAYSGQCLLSSVIGGRSGNRGRCAQPCRKPYLLVAGKVDRYGRLVSPERVAMTDRYLLSTKDLCTLAALPELVKRPFAALKIEGRMRSPEYVAIAVSRYRRALNRAVSGQGSPAARDIEDLAVMFSRGFTGGYLSGDRGSALMERGRPENQGLYLGRITSCSGGEIRVHATGETIPGAGDGLVAVDRESGGKTGFVIRTDAEKIGKSLVIRDKTVCRPGMGLYLTRSLRLEKEAREIIGREGPPEKFPHKIDLRLTFSEGNPPVLTGKVRERDGRVIEVSREADFIPEKATGKPTSNEDVVRQVAKTGGTGFVVKEISLSTPGNLFIPLGLLNQFRRNFLEGVRQEILASYRPGEAGARAVDRRLGTIIEEFSRIPGRKKELPPDLAVLCDNMESAVAAQAVECSMVYLETKPDPASVKADLLPALETVGKPGRLAWKWPHIEPPGWITEVLPYISGLREAGLQEIMTENPGSADALRRVCPAIRVTGGPGLNIFNHLAIRALSPPFSAFTLSSELSGKDIADLAARIPDAGTGIYVMVQGTIEAMVTADTLVDLIPPDILEEDRQYGLVDLTGRVFPIRTGTNGMTQISNADELCLLDYLPELSRAGVDRFLIDARGRGPAYAAGMAALYREALSLGGWMQGGPDTGVGISKIKIAIREMARGRITAGPYIRGLAED
jgi:putative protease